MTTKVVVPYARALLDFAVEKGLMHQIGADVKNLQKFLNTTELRDCLKNPTISQKVKKFILTKAFQSQVHPQTFNLLMVLVNRGRINLLEAFVTKYEDISNEQFKVRKMQVSTAIPFTNIQKTMLIDKLTTVSKSSGVTLDVIVDSRLIAGFSIKTQSKVVDFSFKNKLKNLAKHFDIDLEI